jgi:rhodanese-related sulfurtransferase
MEVVMRKWMLISLMSVSVLVLGACQGSPVESVDADQALELLASDSSIVLLDVREYHEHVESRIEGSALLSLSVIDLYLEEQYPDKETTFIVYCRSGRRSAEAIEIMLEKGYQNIYDLGGIIDWPYETVSGRPS